MPLRYIALAAASVVLLGALVLLLVEVKASPEIEIPEQALAEARARYARNKAARARPAPAPAPRAPAATRSPPRPQRPERPAAVEGDLEEPAEEEHEFDMDPARQRLAMLRDKREARENIRERREQVRQYYEQGDYKMALREARGLIPDAPTNRYVMRVAVTSACALGEQEIAQQYYSQLFREEDRRIVRVRCARHGIEL